MAPCSNCGALIGPEVTACPYCHAPTAAAARALELEEKERVRAQQERDRARQQSGVEAAASAKRALVWAAIGFVFCLFVVPPVVGVVLALRARKLARDSGVLIPLNATLALAISSGELVLVLALYVWVGIQSANVNKRKEQLHTQFDKAAQAEKLEQPTACGLVELDLLEEGFETTNPTSISGFECPGKLVVSGDKATLEDVYFHRDSSHQKTVATACLKRGARWIVDDLREGHVSCEGPAPAASGSASSGHHRHAH